MFLSLLTLLLKVILIDNKFVYPESIGHVQYKNMLTNESKLRKVCNYLQETFNRSYLKNINKFTFRILNFRLFNSYHIFGLYEYRIIHEYLDGSKVENLKIFNNDLSPAQSAEVFSTRYLQALLYPVSNAVRIKRRDPSEVINPDYYELFLSMCKFAVKDIDTSELKKSFIYVIPMDLPTSFVGSYKPWLKHKWKKFYEFDYISKNQCFHDVDFDDNNYFKISEKYEFTFN